MKLRHLLTLISTFVIVASPSFAVISVKAFKAELEAKLGSKKPEKAIAGFAKSLNKQTIKTLPKAFRINAYEKLSLNRLGLEKNSASSEDSNIQLAVDEQTRSIATISFDKGVTTVAALAGEVTYTDTDGNVTKIDIGTGLIINSDGTKSTKTLSELIAAEKASGKSGNPDSLTSVLNNVVAQLAINTSNGEYGVNSGALLAAAVKVAATANPDAAIAYTQTAIVAIAQAKSLTPAQKQDAITAVAEAALSTATTPEQQQALAAAIQKASENANVASSTNPTGSSAFITPPVELTAVVLVSPSS